MVLLPDTYLKLEAGGEGGVVANSAQIKGEIGQNGIQYILIKNTIGIKLEGKKKSRFEVTLFCRTSNYFIQTCEYYSIKENTVTMEKLVFSGTGEIHSHLLKQNCKAMKGF